MISKDADGRSQSGYWLTCRIVRARDSKEMDLPLLRGEGFHKNKTGKLLLPFRAGKMLLTLNVSF